MSYILIFLIYWMLTLDRSRGYNFWWEVRFNDGYSDYDGKLEIRYGDQWGYVCADGFGQVEGDVVCKNTWRSTRRSSSTRSSYRSQPALEIYPVSNFSLISAHVILEGVKCNGSEDRIFECQHNGLFNASCPSSSIIGLKCGRYQSDYIIDSRNPLTRTHIGLYDPKYHLTREDNNLNTAYRLPYWWGYFCDDPNGYRQAEIHCYGHPADFAATRRFSAENNLFYTLSNTNCFTEREATEIQCGSHHECREVKNESIICITDESDLSITSRYASIRRPSRTVRSSVRGYSLIEDIGRAHFRLVGGTSRLDGRLEVSRGGGIWGSVCFKFWGLGSARFACRHLGFSGVEEYGTVEGNASYPMLQYLSCNDERETHWYDCLHRYTRTEKVVCSPYAFVRCSDIANEGTIRLTGTAVAGEGIIEIFHDGAWGTVRNRYFPDVVCNQLGYPGYNNSRTDIQFELFANRPVVMDIIDCQGFEASVLDCVHRWYNLTAPGYDPSKMHYSGADIRCNRPGNFTPRLYNGTSVYEGRLEVWEGNQWRRVCSSTIGSQEADVICKQLGHKSGETLYNWPKFGNGINPVLSWSFRCNDMVPFLNQCDYSYISSRKLDCNSVAVKCFKSEHAAHAARRLLLGVGAFVVLGFAVVSVLVSFTVKRKCVQGNEHEERSGQPPAYNSVPTAIPAVDNSEQNIDPQDETPPPSYESLRLEDRSEVKVDSGS